jgi:hypothetical protein
MGECIKQELPVTKPIVFAFPLILVERERERERDREERQSGTQTKCLFLLSIVLLQFCVTVTNSKYLKLHAFCRNYQKAPSFVLVYTYLTYFALRNKKKKMISFNIVKNYISW